MGEVLPESCFCGIAISNWRSSIQPCSCTLSQSCTCCCKADVLTCLHVHNTTRPSCGGIPGSKTGNTEEEVCIQVSQSKRGRYWEDLPCQCHRIPQYLQHVCYRWIWWLCLHLGWFQQETTLSVPQVSTWLFHCVLYVPWRLLNLSVRR